MKSHSHRCHGLVFIFVFLLNILSIFAEDMHMPSGQLNDLVDSQTNFLDLDTILTVDEAGLFFSTEKEFLDEAKRRTVPLPTEENWKVVPLNSNGPYAKLKRTLQRVSKEVFSTFNKLSTSHMYTSCKRVSNVKMLTSPYGIQYKYLCDAKVTSLPDRRVEVWAWDRFGVVMLMDARDVTENDGGYSEDVDAWYSDMVQIPEALEK